MREMGEVPAGADCPLLGDPWETGCVEGVDELPQGARGDAGVPLGQYVDTQGQQHPENVKIQIMISNTLAIGNGSKRGCS